MPIDLGLGHLRIQHQLLGVPAGSNQYLPAAGITELRCALAKRESVAVEELCITVGASLGLAAIFASLPHSTSLLCPVPYYPAYVKLAGYFGLELLFYSISANNGWQPSIEELEETIAPNTNTLIVNWPGNPTGDIPHPDLLNRLAEFVRRNNLVVISDEVYREFVYELPSVPNLRDYFGVDNLITVRSFSKEYGLAGERVGYVIGAPRVIAHLVRVHWTFVLSPPLTSQLLALAVLESEEPGRLPRWRKLLKETRDQVQLILAASQRLRVHTPKAGIFFWIEIPFCPLSADEVVKMCLDRTGVTVISGSAFGIVDSTFIRASFACEHNEAIHGFTLLRESLDALALMHI